MGRDDDVFRVGMLGLACGGRPQTSPALLPICKNSDMRVDRGRLMDGVGEHKVSGPHGPDIYGQFDE